MLLGHHLLCSCQNIIIVKVGMPTTGQRHQIWNDIIGKIPDPKLAQTDCWSGDLATGTS